MGMKQILVVMVAVVLVGCSKDTPETSQAAEAEPQVASKPTPEPTPEPDPVSPADEKLIADPTFEKAVRKKLKKPEGELTEADLEKVTDLSLDFTKITDEGLKELAKFQNLTHLSLVGTQITDEGLKELAKLQKLKMLGLAQSKITDAGLKEVAKLQKLEMLNLNGTKVTKEGVTVLKKALPNCLIIGP
jgi:repressor of nif and glnA expression